VLRRGFKTDANALAAEVRLELGLTPIAPLDPRALAEHLEIPVVALTAGGYEPTIVDHFTRIDRGAFSAATVFDGHRRVIVHNDSHSAGRQANNITHEISHGLLLHSPAPALGAGGCRNWSSDVEDEATWLAGCLLVTEEAALHIVRRALPIAATAGFYGVSEQLLRWRINATGARTRVARSRRGGATTRREATR
jgi:Zn-dependent peptidase ImmA (M78 family)